MTDTTEDRYVEREGNPECDHHVTKLRVFLSKPATRSWLCLDCGRDVRQNDEPVVTTMPKPT